LFAERITVTHSKVLYDWSLSLPSEESILMNGRVLAVVALLSMTLPGCAPSETDKKESADRSNSDTKQLTPAPSPDAAKLKYTLDANPHGNGSAKPIFPMTSEFNPPSSFAPGSGGPSTGVKFEDPEFRIEGDDLRVPISLRMECLHQSELTPTNSPYGEDVFVSAALYTEDNKNPTVRSCGEYNFRSTGDRRKRNFFIDWARLKPNQVYWAVISVTERDEGNDLRPIVEYCAKLALKIASVASAGAGEEATASTLLGIDIKEVFDALEKAGIKFKGDNDRIGSFTLKVMRKQGDAAVRAVVYPTDLSTYDGGLKLQGDEARYNAEIVIFDNVEDKKIGDRPTEVVKQ
jgi:hypothetical protein